MSVESLTEKYFAERSALDAALGAWEAQLERAARNVDSGAIVSGRVKSYRSLLGKAYREAGKTRTWSQFGDLVALKAVFPTTRGVLEFSEWILEQEGWSPSLDEKQGLPTELKYQAKQFDLISTDIADSEGQPLRVEVQVRTAVSDAWYVVDHRLQYKGIVELPSDLKRKLNRLMVLAELFDEEVEAVLTRQVELPEYAVARLYDELIRLSEKLFDGHTRTSRPEGLLELVLCAYSEQEIESLEATIKSFSVEHESSLKSIITGHLYGSESFVEHRDWIYYEPEVVLIAERATSKPSLFKSTIAGSDFEPFLEPMISEFRAIGS